MAKLKSLNLDLTPRIKKLELLASERATSTLLEGDITTFTKGSGLEFAGYRAYSFGDDARLIDWKASLRAQQLVVKEFEEERLLNVVFLFDVSETMLFGSRKKLKVEYAAEIINSLAYGFLNAGSAVGLFMFSNTLKAFVYPEVGSRVFYNLRKELTNLENYGGTLDINATFKEVLSILRSNALIIIVSDFIGFDSKFIKWLNILSQFFQVTGVMVLDPLDLELPKEIGQVAIRNPFTGETKVIDAAKYSETYRELALKKIKFYQDLFFKVKSSMIVFKTTRDWLNPMIKFFRKNFRIG